jgi:putative membrane protein
VRIAAAIVVLLAVTAAPVRGHAGDPVPHGPSAWDVAALAALAIGGWLYLAGSLRLAARGARVRATERVAFWVGWTGMVAAIAPPLDGAALERFSMHMAQHELLMLVGAPLMIVGRPLVPWLWALPDALRPRAGQLFQSRAAGGIWNVLTRPAIAWILHGAAIWVWHLPVLYEAAVRNEAIHALQHATFVGTAVFFWWGLVYGRYGRAAYGASVFYVFITTLHTGVLGALFALSRQPFYPLYRDQAAGLGIDAAADQQLAGLYMWIPAGLVMMLFGLALVVAWLSESERRARAGRTLVLVLLAGAAVTACGAIPHESSARQLTGGDPSRGRARIRHYGCDSCHTIPGIPTADATVGPPLTAVARRVYLAGRLENTPENMMRWVRTPHRYAPDTAMPEMGVTESDSRDIVAYLYTLR